MAPKKADADDFRAFLDSLKEESWIKRSERNWWPEFVSHYSAIPNAAQVLTDGHLYSRARLAELKKTGLDSGSQQVLDGTGDWVLNSVRLYLRPLTPTQYHSEGIRIEPKITYLGAHCPTPVYLMFDAVEILSRTDCQFSNGNLASLGAMRYSSAEELARLPWQEIYHNGWFERDEGPSIIFHRCAEAVIPDQLDLSALKIIYCRSEAEKETLLHLLSKSLRKKYERIIASSTRRRVFFRQHTFVERARLGSKSIRFEFSPETQSIGPFRKDLVISSPQLDRDIIRDGSVFDVDRPLRIILPKELDQYTVRLELNGYLAYANEFKELGQPV